MTKLHSLSLLLKIESLASLNQIKESVPETPEPSQKTYPLDFVPLILLSVPRSVLARVIQRNRSNRKDKQISKRLTVEIGSHVMEAGKPYNLPWVRWRHRKAGGRIQSKSEGLRTREAPWCKSWSVQKPEQEHQYLRAGEDGGPTLSRESKSALFPFCSVQALEALDDAQPQRWDGSSFLSQMIQRLISSRNILMYTPRNNVLPAIWAPLSPVKLTQS